jgi:signal transduction histidine kinase
VSSNADSIELFSPNYQNLSFPIVSGREQILAVRFANLQQRYPIYFHTADLAFESWITTFDNPFALLTPSLSLAIYLGYSFGVTSQSLRKKLNEVEQLSIEKQQILSTQNETLERQVKERTAALNQSLTDLKSTQAQLIQSEKMASLGEVTAGIAHEIQNPLNFVNNFAEVNAELAEELKEVLASDNYRNGNDQVASEIVGDIKQNSEKIKHHGKRAENIVKSMLEHSRSSTGEKQLTDINLLVDECLRIGYESFKNRNPSFNATLKTDFDSDIDQINIIPADMGRVLLNLYNNAFYAIAGNRHQKRYFIPLCGLVQDGLMKRL